MTNYKEIGKFFSISIFFLCTFLFLSLYTYLLFSSFIYYPSLFCHYFHKLCWPVTSHLLPETHKFHNQYIPRLTLNLCTLWVSPLDFTLSWERRMQTYKSVNKRQICSGFINVRSLLMTFPKSHTQLSRLF